MSLPSRAPIDAEVACADTIVEPESVEEICELVRKCEADRLTLAPIANARTLSQIRRSPVAVGISLRRLSRVIAYEPDDMTIVAEAGISVGELNAAMKPAHQRLPVDPCNPALTTLGSLVASSHSGPLRLSEGTARDLMIGIRFVSHGGKLVHGGGRVVKNVAGYDLMKVMGGSFGTLGIITEATFKVRPIPTQYCLAIVNYPRSADAFVAANIVNEALPLSHLEVLSPALAAQLESTGNYLLLAGFSGTPLEIGYQAEQLRELLGDQVRILDDDAALAVYQHMRDLDFLSTPLAAQIAVPPAKLASILEICGAEFRAHAGSGVAQMMLTDEHSADAAHKNVTRWRDAAHSMRGNLRVIAAASTIRDSVDFFDTPNAGALKLMRSLKTAFDPIGVFNPGCFVGGI